MNLSGRIIEDFSSIDECVWAQLDHADNPFLSYAFLHALESSGSVGPHVGWQPHHLALYEGEQLLAFAPTWVKNNSHGEFVFDWAWADAYHRHQIPYYPKLLTGIPYSPVSGPRLLVLRGHEAAPALRRQLIEFALERCAREDFSSWHCNFTSPDDQEALGASPLLARMDWQYHWKNEGYESFDDFLAALRSRKRKNIRRERRQVREAGIRFRWKTGTALSDSDLDFIHGCYINTFRAYGNHPVLNREFFASIAARLDSSFLVSIASREDKPLAMSLFLTGGGRLYGRYWGCTEDLPGLHFEAAYYQGIEYCIRQKIHVFESGAQGEHKISRGFMPSKTRSFHFIRDEAFRGAIAEYLSRETSWMAEYREQLVQHDPFRRDRP